MSSDSQELIDYLNTNKGNQNSYKKKHFDHVQTCTKSPYLQNDLATQQQLNDYITQNQQKVMSFIEPKDYSSNNNQNNNQNNNNNNYDNITNDNVGFKLQHAQWQLNRDLSSVSGGAQRRDKNNEHIFNGSNTEAKPYGYPNNSENPPQNNIIVAIDQKAYSHSGYYQINYTPTKYNTPQNAHVLVSSDIEFEIYSLNELHNSPYITQLQEQHQERLNNNNNNNNDVKNIGLIELITINKKIDQENTTRSANQLPLIEHLYLEKDAYISEVKNHLIRKLKAAVYAHHQSPNKQKNIEFNLTLPGMGCFATINVDKNDIYKGQVKLTEYLAPLAAQAYKEAIKEFAKFNNMIPDTLGKLAKVRVVRPSHEPKDKAYQKDAIDAVFFDNNYTEDSHSELGITIAGIRVAANDNFVENFTLSDKNLQQVVMVCGDSRAQPGNENGYKTQEPGVFSHFANLRYLMCAHQNKAMLFNTFENNVSLDQYIQHEPVQNKCIELALQAIQTYLNNADTYLKEKSENNITGAIARFGFYMNKKIHSQDTYSISGKMRAEAYKTALISATQENEVDRLIEHLNSILELFKKTKGTTLKENVRNNLCAYFNIDPTCKNATDDLISAINTTIENVSPSNNIDNDNDNERVILN